jgi:hypothetical protein
MKNTHHKLLAALVFCCLTASGHAQYSASVLSDNPLGYWRLDEPVVHPAITNLGSLGTSAEGTNFGAGYPVAGALNGGGDTAMQFAPTASSRVVLGNPGAFNFTTGNFTLEVWAKPATLSGAMRIFSNRRTPTGGGAAGYGFGFFGAGNLRLTAYGVADITSPAASFSVGQWYHLVVVRNGATLQFYTNGVALGGTVAIGSINSSPRPLQFCRNPDTDLGVEAFDGVIDEPAVYSYALSATRVQAHYAGGTNSAVAASYDSVVLADTPAGYWRLNARPPVAVNAGSLGAAANGVYLGSVANGRGGALVGEANGAAGFNGTDARVEIPYHAALNGSVFSIECWAKVLGGAGSYRSPLSARDNVGTTKGYIFYASAGNTWEFWNGNGSGGWDNPATRPVVAGDWVHLVGTYDGTNKSFYVNGELVVQNSPVMVVNALRALRIGAGQNEGNPNFLFNGDLDEVAVYGKALMPESVVAHYVAARGSNPPPVLATITQPPLGATNVEESTVTLSVRNVGGVPFRYQWLLNGVPLPGRTSPTLALSNLVFGVDSGSYQVAVSNAAGVVTSAVAQVLVTPSEAPVFAQAPQSISVYAGGTARFSALATGSVRMNYQWQYDGTDLPDQTNATLAVTNVQPDNAGTYRVVARNNGGATNAAAVLTVVTPAGEGYEAGVYADNPVAYYRLDETHGPGLFDRWGRNNGWYSNAVAYSLAGALTNDANPAVRFDGTTGTKGQVPYSPALNTGVFTVECWARAAGGAGTYRAAVSARNDVGPGTTYGYILYATSGNNWEFWSGNGSGWTPQVGGPVTLGEWAHLVGVYDGTNKWFYVNGALRAVTSTVFTPNTVTPLRIGAGQNENVVGSFFFNGDVDEVAYYGLALAPDRILAHYTNGAGQLAAGVSPTVLRAPQSRTNTVGTATSFAVIPGGSLPFACQWRLNGVPLDGQTNATLSLPGVQGADAGSYDVVINNPVGSITSAVAVLYVPVTITAQPQGGMRSEGEDVILSIAAAGTPVLSYQWQKNGIDLPGATSSLLRLNPLTTGDEGIYRVRITNILGAIYSDATPLTVSPTSPPMITLPPGSRTVYDGGTARFLVQAGSYPRLTCQWLLEGVPLAGETNPVLTLGTVTTSQSGGAYRAVVGNEAGFSTSAVAVLTVLAPAAITCASNLLADAPAGYWRLGEAAGPLALDALGGNDGWYSNRVTFGVAGAVTNDSDTAVRFDGAGAKADVPWAAALNQSNFTVACWARVTGSSGTYRSPVTSRADGSTRGYIFYASPGNAWEFWTGTGGPIGTWHTLTGPAVLNDTWVHLVGTYDGTNKCFYVNGMLVGTAAVPFAPNPDRPLRIGGGATDQPGGDFFLPGDVDEVAVYGKALSQERVITHYTAARARYHNQAPVANPDDADAPQDRATLIAAAKLTANDTDAENDALTLLGVDATSASGGSVSLAGGTITYRPAAGYTGPDRFNYTITDGYAATATGSVLVAVVSTNLPTLNVVYGPVITNGQFQVRFAGVPGLTYTIEHSDALSPVDWRKSVNLTAPTNDPGFGVGIFEFSEPTSGTAQRFYRTVWPAY